MSKLTFAALVAAVAATACSGPSPVPPPTSAPTLPPPASTSSPAPADVCHPAGQVLCALDSRVNPTGSPAQQLVQLKATICSGHWSSTVRPPVGTTNAWKAADFIDLTRPIDPSTGQPVTSFTQTEGDHRLSIGLGGDPGAYKINGRWEETTAVTEVGSDLLPVNFSLEYPASPNLKDGVETHLHDQVCAGTMALATARQLLVNAWLAPFPGYKSGGSA